MPFKNSYQYLVGNIGFKNEKQSWKKSLRKWSDECLVKKNHHKYLPGTETVSYDYKKIHTDKKLNAHKLNLRTLIIIHILYKFSEFHWNQTIKIESNIHRMFFNQFNEFNQFRMNATNHSTIKTEERDRMKTKGHFILPARLHIIQHVTSKTNH